MTLGEKRHFYSTQEAPGGLALSGTLHRATFLLDSRPGRSALHRAGGHPKSQGEGTPKTPEQAALNRSPQRSPRAATPLPPCPAALAARLPVTCGRREEAGGWLRRAGLGPSTHSLPSTGLRPHHQGPETGQQTGLQFLRRHHRGARTRNRARAAAQVMLGPVSSSGLGAGEACAARLLPAAYSGCKETRLRVVLTLIAQVS